MSDTRPGLWPSPITPEMIGSAGVRFGFSQPFADDVFWDEGRPNEGGRVVVVSERNGDILPAPWSARTRVHEMGGLAWLVTVWSEEPGLLFCEASDQRLYWKAVGAQPQAITPASPEGFSWRYCDMVVRGDEVWCIRESDAHGATTRAIVAIARDGTVRILNDDWHFYAHVTLSPDQQHLAWISWNHPDMPWDAAALQVARISDGELVDIHCPLGGAGESTQSPAWIDDHTLAVVCERSGWWNPWLVPLNGQPSIIVDEATEWGVPLWMVGWRTLVRSSNNVLIGTRGSPERRDLVSLDPHSGHIERLEQPLSCIESFAVDGDAVTAFGESPTQAGAVIRLGLNGLPAQLVAAKPIPVGQEWLAQIHAVTVPGDDGRVVHAIVHEPTNPGMPQVSCCPTIITAHGGPTGHSQATTALTYAAFTSRGFRVVDVNYGGSTGYGRAYRESLLGQWGVVDTQDVLAVASYFADPARTPAGGMFIRGGSAGGFAVLNALVHSTMFDGGINYYGVADLIPLAQDTHDFESRYLDSLVGPYPERADLYVQRSPLTYASQVSAPLLILQGADDPIVVPSQSTTFRDACQAQGLRCDYYEFAGESHGFRRSETIVTCAQLELDFLASILMRNDQSE